MSIDFEVFTREQLTLVQLESALRGEGVRIGEVYDDRLVFSRPEEQWGNCYVDGPWKVLEEDIAKAVLERDPGVRWMYEVHFSGFPEDPVFPFEVLARVTGGVLWCDETLMYWQDDDLVEIETSELSSMATTPTLGLTMVWWGLGGDGLLDGYWDSAQSFFPEALPRRFGDMEPFQYQISEVGRDGARTQWLTGRGSLGFSCANSPAVSGQLLRLRGSWTLRLRLLAQPFFDPVQQDRLKRFFIAVSKNVGADYGCAEVRNAKMANGAFLGDTSLNKEESASTLVGSARGISPHPTWWSYFGPVYLRLIDQQLRNPREGWFVEGGPEGAFLATSAAPARLEDLRPYVLGKRIPGGWFDRELWATRKSSAKVHPRGL